ELTYQLRGSVSDEAASSITAQLGAEVVIAGSLQKAGAANPPAYRLDIKAILDVADSSQVETGRADYESIADGIALMAEPVCTAAAVVPANMVLVPAGTFAMGSTNGYDREKPVHQVSISKPFYISKYEITQKEWTAVMGSNPSYFKGDTLPVEQVSWFDAVEYCNKRSQKEGLTPVYSGSGAAITCNFNANGYRLPTEAEWEWAAKGGGKDGPMYEYAGGNDVNSVGWYDANSGVRTHEAGTHEVGTKAPNSLGIYDMSGNVWEWCWDWYGDYSGGSQTDPIGAASESDRVVRGGGWGDYAQYLRSASRYGNTPTDDRAIDVGFRVVRP
ncbi:formylglycine-generating enzyme family protein, partial [Breznakiellaceae bacterium SP9]